MIEKVEIKWNKNNIVGGKDCPHHDTTHEGQYASLMIRYKGLWYDFKCPEYEYGIEIPNLIKDLKRSMKFSAPVIELTDERF